MLSRQTVERLVLDGVTEINDQLPAESRVAVALGAPLVGDDGALDSLNVVLLLAALEERLAGRHGVAVGLLDRVSDGDLSFMATAATLVDAILARADAPR